MRRITVALLAAGCMIFPTVAAAPQEGITPRVETPAVEVPAAATASAAATVQVPTMPVAPAVAVAPQVAAPAAAVAAAPPPQAASAEHGMKCHCEENQSYSDGNRICPIGNNGRRELMVCESD